MPYGLTATGFVRKPYDVILAEVEAYEKGNTTAGPALNVSATSVVGQLNAAFGAQVDELWQVAEALDAAFDPDRAEDAAQDNLYSLTNSLRRAATYSRVLLTVTLDDADTLIAGVHIVSVDGFPDRQFTPEEDFTADAAGDYDVWFVALESGPVVANSGTLTSIDVGPAGWTGATNAEDASIGKPIESNSAYRIRRALELAAQGGGTLDGIRGDLSQLADVESVSMIENTGSVADDLGLPSHSFEAVVLGGDEQEIAESIWKNKPAGIATHGGNVNQVTDSEGREHDVWYSRPTEIEIYAGVTVEVDQDEYAGDAALKAALVAATQTPTDPAFLDSGDDVYAARLICTALEVAGVLDVHVGLSTVSVPLSSTGETRIEIDERELGVLDTSRITIYGSGPPG